GVIYPNVELCKDGKFGKDFQRSRKLPSSKNERSKGTGPKLNKGTLKAFDSQIKEPTYITKGSKNITPSKLNKAKRAGLMEIEGARCNVTGTRHLKLRSQPQVTKGTEICKPPSGKRTSIVLRKLEIPRFWKRTRKKARDVV
ncbi:unnamed protein product, partial [Staurois parvus]